jgi:hypothetical protein
MFNLNLAYVNQADREREIESGLRRRQILDATDGTPASSEPAPRSMPSPRPTAVRARATSR